MKTYRKLITNPKVLIGCVRLPWLLVAAALYWPGLSCAIWHGRSAQPSSTPVSESAETEHNDTTAVFARTQAKYKTKLERTIELSQLLDSEKIPSEEKIRSFGAEADSMLVDIITNTSQPARCRVNAIKSLGYFRNKRAQMVLRQILTDPAWKKPFRVAAIAAVVRTLGNESVAILKKYAISPDPQLRLACVKALDALSTPEAEQLLKAMQLRERDVVVLQEIDSALRRAGKHRFLR